MFVVEKLILAWDGRTYATNHQAGANDCSPITSSPDHADQSSAVASFTALGSYSGVAGSLPPLNCGLFDSVSVACKLSYCLALVNMWLQF